ISGRIPPGGALESLLPFQESQVHRSRPEVKAMAHVVDVAEFRFNIFPDQEQLLSDRLVIEAGGDEEAVHAEFGQLREEHLDLDQVGVPEDGRIGADPETELLCLHYGFDRAFEGALAFEDPVVSLLKSVEVDVEGQ